MTVVGQRDAIVAAKERSLVDAGLVAGSSPALPRRRGPTQPLWSVGSPDRLRGEDFVVAPQRFRLRNWRSPRMWWHQIYGSNGGAATSRLGAASETDSSVMKSRGHGNGDDSEKRDESNCASDSCSDGSLHTSSPVGVSHRKP